MGLRPKYNDLGLCRDMARYAFIQESRSVPWITLEIRRKICRRNKTRAKAKKTGSSQ